MKAYRKDPDFKPVVIEIESEDELRYLWHLLSLDKTDVESFWELDFEFPDDVDSNAMFVQIDNLLNKTKQ